MGVANLDDLVITYLFGKISRPYSRTDGRARLAGGPNPTRRQADERWAGDMFDGVGLLRAVVRTAVAGSKILLTGTGGAGRAIAEAVAASIPWSTSVLIGQGRLSRK